MNYEWNDAKSEETRRRRGFGFEVMEDFDWQFAQCADVQMVSGEERQLWIGPIADRLFAVVITRRNENTRVISLRRAVNTEIAEWRNNYE